MGATVERRTALREDGATRAVLRACLPRGESCAREHDERRQAPGEARRRGGQEEKLELTRLRQPRNLITARRLARRADSQIASPPPFFMPLRVELQLDEAAVANAIRR